MEKIVKLPYCVSCCGVLNFARWEVPLKMSIDETFQAVSRSLIENSVSEDTPDFRDSMQRKQLPGSEFTCICCLNVLRQQEVFQLCEEIITGIDALDLNTTTVQLDIQVPAAIEVCRVVARFLIKEHVKPNPRFETVLDRMIAWYLLTKRGIEVTPTAAMKVTIKYAMSRQLELCLAIYPEFRPKKQRKRAFPGEDGEATGENGDKEEDEEDISQSNIDKVLIAIRSMNASNIESAEPRYLTHMAKQKVTRSLSVDYGLVYVYGRYWKYARDVPQSAWTISAHQEVNSHEALASSTTNNSSNDAEHVAAPSSSSVLRVGRASVTEIVKDAVVAITRATSVLLHGCGREDIDVRCLGNGRPFVLQIIAPLVPITPAVLSQIEELINAGEMTATNPLPIKDIAVQSLQVTTAKTWEIMQKEAEEKKKAYRCVCFSSRPITKQELYATFNDRKRWQEYAKQQFQIMQQQHQSESSAQENASDAQLMLMDENMVDEEGIHYLFTIQQQTPLRVMHRRVLIERRRAIYAIEAEYLNEHFFLLSLVTGAGTYVKEFVHGDLGRTQPNVGSLLGNTESEILQLDVIWLYDHFDRLLLPGGEKLYEEHQQRLHQRWLHRRKLLFDHRKNLEMKKKILLANADSSVVVLDESSSNNSEAKKIRLLADTEKEDFEKQVDEGIISNQKEEIKISGEEGIWLELPALSPMSHANSTKKADTR